MIDKINKPLFGKRLSECMKDNNDTVYTLADYLHLSPSAISKYTSGTMKPKQLTIEAIADKYRINPEWLSGAVGADQCQVPRDVAKKIPILNTITKGSDIIDPEDISGFEYVQDGINIDFCLYAKDSSMLNARILQGDLVYIRQQPEVEDGDIAAVQISESEDNYILRRVRKMPSTIILLAENPNYPEMLFYKKEVRKVRILGKAISFKSELRR